MSGAAVDIAALLCELARIPDADLPFDVAQPRVLPLFGIDPPTLREWQAAGLRSRPDANGRPTFSSTELHYLSLRVGQGGVYRQTLGTWAEAARASLAPTGGHRIGYYAQEVPGLPEGVAIEVLTPTGRQRVPYRPRTVVASFDVAHDGPAPALSPELRPLLDRIAALQLVFVPDALRGRRDFLDATGFIDCEDAGAELLALCRQEGIPARPVYGLVASRPLATAHSCVELRNGDGWLAVSPLLVSTIHRFGGLNPAQFPTWSALGSMYVPLAPEPTPLARYGDVEVPVSALVSDLP